MQNITLEQAQGMVADGLLSKKAFQSMIEQGKLAVFRFRTQANKPQVVQDVHNGIINLIEPKAFELLEAGYRPSIVWNKIGDATPEEEATD